MALKYIRSLIKTIGITPQKTQNYREYLHCLHHSIISFKNLRKNPYDKQNPLLENISDDCLDSLTVIPKFQNSAVCIMPPKFQHNPEISIIEPYKPSKYAEMITYKYPLLKKRHCLTLNI